MAVQYHRRTPPLRGYYGPGSPSWSWVDQGLVVAINFGDGTVGDSEAYERRSGSPGVRNTSTATAPNPVFERSRHGVGYRFENSTANSGEAAYAKFSNVHGGEFVDRQQLTVAMVYRDFKPAQSGTPYAICGAAGAASNTFQIKMNDANDIAFFVGGTGAGTGSGAIDIGSGVTQKMTPIVLTWAKGVGSELYVDGRRAAGSLLNSGTTITHALQKFWLGVPSDLGPPKEIDGANGRFGCFFIVARRWGSGQAAQWSRDPYGYFRPNEILPELPPSVPRLRTRAETTIANAALTLLGERRINDLNEGSRTANMVNDRFDDLRDEVLRTLPWNFATRRASLPADVTAPLFGPRRSYTLPNDCIRVLEVDDRWDLGWLVEGRSIVTSITDPLDIVYTARITDVYQMDASFRQVLAAALAFDLAEAVVGDDDKVAMIFRRLRDAWFMAAQANGQEIEADEVDRGIWVRSHGDDDRNRII